MPIVIPTNAKQYPQPKVSLPSAMRFPETAIEGDRFVPLEFLWTSAGTTQYVDLTTNSPNPLSRISAMFVDNSQCGQDVTLYFITSGSTVVIPAYTDVLLPIPANSLNFYASCPLALSIDVTRMDVFNFIPPPVSIPKSAFQSIAVIVQAVWAVSTIQIIPAGVIGTLENLYIQPTWNASAGFASPMTVRDGTASVIASYQWDGLAASVGNDVIKMENLNLRFNGGLQLVIAGTVPSTGVVSVNAYYRTP